MTVFPLLAFGFANVAILGWLAAAATPILIHLWMKRVHRETPWAAVRFLQAAIKRHSRRVATPRMVAAGDPHGNDLAHRLGSRQTVAGFAPRSGWPRCADTSGVGARCVAFDAVARRPSLAFRASQATGH